VFILITKKEIIAERPLLLNGCSMFFMGIIIGQDPDGNLRHVPTGTGWSCPVPVNSVMNGGFTRPYPYFHVIATFRSSTGTMKPRDY
jgi:hypothetical protein